eukprot:1144581-Pelagomonas_calceolata.AAC.2
MSATTFATNWPWLAMTGFLGSRPGQGKGKGAGLSTGSFFHQCRIWLLGACIQEEQLTMTDSIADTCSQFTKGCSPRKRTVGKALMPSSPQNCLFGSASMSWITEGREGKSYSSGDGFSLGPGWLPRAGCSLNPPISSLMGRCIADWDSHLEVCCKDKDRGILLTMESTRRLGRASKTFPSSLATSLHGPHLVYHFTKSTSLNGLSCCPAMCPLERKSMQAQDKDFASGGL